MSALTDLYPKKVFEFFELISSVPHGSDNTAKISELCCSFARERGLDYYKDELGNVIIYKPASKGYENHKPVIIQGHMDMVTVKTDDCDIDLLSDGLKLTHDNDYIWAEGTSLGADDGIALAMAMAVLDSDSIEHPPIESVFTVNEETGMDGAHFIDTSRLKGRTMLNIDSEEEGVITCGCAGGIRVCGSFALNSSECYQEVLKISVYELTGGHSGSEIQKGRANANILMAQLLAAISNDFDFRLISIKGGEKDNAIANSCEAEISIDAACIEEIIASAEKFAKNAKEAYRLTDPKLKISALHMGKRNSYVASGEATRNIISAMSSMPDGVQKMSEDIEGLVQTSLNFGIIDTIDDEVKMTFCLRSSVGSELNELAEKIEAIIASNGGASETGGKYPAWEYSKSSILQEKAICSFEKVYGNKPKLSLIHAGLECGLFAEKIDNLDCISFGPDILDIHTVNEKLDIKSTQRVWSFLIELLKYL